MTTLAPSMLRLKEEIRTVDPLLVLRGSGRTLWSDEHTDKYIERLRREDAFDIARNISPNRRLTHLLRNLREVLSKISDAR